MPDTIETIVAEMEENINSANSQDWTNVREDMIRWLSFIRALRPDDDVLDVAREIRNEALNLSKRDIQLEPLTVWLTSLAIRLENSTSVAVPDKVWVELPDHGAVTRIQLAAPTEDQRDESTGQGFAWICVPVHGAPQQTSGECEGCESLRLASIRNRRDADRATRDYDTEKHLRLEAEARTEQAEATLERVYRERNGLLDETERRSAQLRKMGKRVKSLRRHLLSPLVAMANAERDAVRADNERLREGIRDAEFDLDEDTPNGQMIGDRLRALLSEQPKEESGLPPCPKCGASAALMRTDEVVGVVGHQCGGGWVTGGSREDWLRYVAENTPCRECGELPVMGEIGMRCGKRVCTSPVHWQTMTEWIARNKREETRDDDGPRRDHCVHDVLGCGGVRVPVGATDRGSLRDSQVIPTVLEKARGHHDQASKYFDRRLHEMLLSVGALLDWAELLSIDLAHAEKWRGRFGVKMENHMVHVEKVIEPTLDDVCERLDKLDQSGEPDAE